MILRFLGRTICYRIFCDDDSPESRELCGKLVRMLRAKGNGARIHLRRAGGVAYVDEDIHPSNRRTRSTRGASGYGSAWSWRGRSDGCRLARGAVKPVKRQGAAYYLCAAPCSVER
jgi:hypothetical protein